MRKAGGILLSVLGIVLIMTTVLGLPEASTYIVMLGIYIVLIVWGAFLVTGGLLCLKRRYWRVCFSSALAAVFLMIVYLTGPLDTAVWLDWFVIITGVLPIIFVSLTRKEWQDISDSVDGEVSNGG